ncbi:uncharacterized protein LOC126415972 isoform X2 [Schistocerca serialis cubense]|uniref:uncharacterized protein LOC126415972 isoform X2 n=1 Tax=Schistocerca serialis cubense TaxID=2023355 RepID=UPI00214E404C|nr:uncharacterized protein LOC126415972 isoform X2 [Schistocerca serialis cubense]
MDGLQEPICAGCEYYEDNYKKALDRFLLYKEKIMCTQTLIQKYERRKQQNQQLVRKLQKSRHSAATVRERFMHYMERYMPLEKSYNDLRAAYNELESKLHTQSTALIALQQHNKQLTALVEVQEKDVNEYKDKTERIEGMLPDSYKLCLKSWKKQLSQDMKHENFCDNGGFSPDKASSISSQDTGFDSSKSMSDDESQFDEKVNRRKGAAGDKRCNNTSKSATPSIPLETSVCDKSVNTSDILRDFHTPCATDSFQNLRDIGVNTSLSMLTSDLNKFLDEVAINDSKNLEQSPRDQGMENHDIEPLPFGADSQMIEPHCSQRWSIFSPVKGAVHSASAEMPPTSAEMPPSNYCVEEDQSKFIQPEKLVFANTDSSKTIPPHVKDTCIAGKSMSILLASEVPVCGEVQSANERDKGEKEDRGRVRGGRGDEEELEEEEGELGLGVGGREEGEGEEEEEEEEEGEKSYDDSCSDGASNISKPDHDKGRNLHAERENVQNAWNLRMQTTLCFKVPSRGARTAESRVASMLQEMKSFAPRLVSPMSPCGNDIPSKNAAVSASPLMRSTDLRTNDLSSVKCDSPQADFGISLTCSNNNSVFQQQQQTAQASDMKKGSLTLREKRNSLLKKSISNKSYGQDTEGTNPNCETEIEPLKRVCTTETEPLAGVHKTEIEPLRRVCTTETEPLAGVHKTEIEPLRRVCKTEIEPLRRVCEMEIEPLKRVCHEECSSKYSHVLARFSIGKDVSSKHHSAIEEQMNNSKNILPDPKYSDVFTHDFVKSLSNLTSIIESKKFLKFAKKKNCQRSRRLRKNILKTIHSHRKHVSASNQSSSNSNIVETASGCFLETVNTVPVSACSEESTPESGKVEERLTMTETVNYHYKEPSGATEVSGSKNKISQLQCNPDMLACKNQQIVPQEDEKAKIHTQKNILRCETRALTCVTQNQVELKESHVIDTLAHSFQPEVDNQIRKSLEEDEKDGENDTLVHIFQPEMDNQTKKSLEEDGNDAGNELMTVDSTCNWENTVNSSECSLATPDVFHLSTSNNAADFERKDTETESRLAYTELLGDLSVSDDDSSPESVNARSESSQCFEAEGSNYECRNEPTFGSNNCSKIDVPQNSVNSGTICELPKVNHDVVDGEKSCNKQYNNGNIKKVSDHSNARYFIPQIATSNKMVVNYEEVEINIPVECRQEICISEQSVDLLDQKHEAEYVDKKRNLIFEAGETISDISTCLSASCNSDGETTNHATFSGSRLSCRSRGSISEVITMNETDIERNSVPSSKDSTDSLAHPKITTVSTKDCTVDSCDVLHDCNTKLFIQVSDVKIDDDVPKKDSLALSESGVRKMGSTDMPDMSNVNSELSKHCNGTENGANKLINQSESYRTMNGHKHIEEKHCSNNTKEICKDIKGTELLTLGSGLQKGTMEHEISDHHKNSDISVNEKPGRELEEESPHPKTMGKENLSTQKCGRISVVGTCNIQKSLINCSVSEEPVIKEQQESNKDDIPVEEIPQSELGISKRDVEEEVKDTAETICEEYYIPQRTKKRIAHKPKPQASGSGSSSEHKNFQSPTQATVVTTMKQTRKKTKRTTEDEQKNTKTINTGLTVNEVAGSLPSLPLNVGTVSMKEKHTLKTKCSSSEATESVNCVSRARKKLKTEVESYANTVVNSTSKRQLKMTRLDDKQLEEPSTHLQAARRSARLKKSETFKLLQKGLDVHATKRRKKLKDEKCLAADSFQDLIKVDTVKTEKCDDGRSTSDVNHVEGEKCDINEALLAGGSVATAQHSKVKKLDSEEDDIDYGAAGPSAGRNKRKIKNETGDESNSKKLAPCLFEKQLCYQTQFENEAKFPVQSSTSEDASNVSCKSDSKSLCLVPLLPDKNKCKEECVDDQMSTSPSQQHDKDGSVTCSKSKTSLGQSRSSNLPGDTNDEYINVHNKSAADINTDCTNVNYAKGDVIRKCLAIQQRNKLAIRRPTRIMLNQQQVFISRQLSQLLEGDFTNEVLNTAVEKFEQDDNPIDAVALVRCILKVLLEEDCNEIDRSHDVRAPPLSVVEEKLITLLVTLRNRCSRFSSLINDFLTAVEYYILNLRTTPEYDLLHILTRFHASLCKAEGLRERAQAFCYDALYSLKRKCFPVIYTILIHYPEVFPRASLGMNSPVCISIVYSIFTSMNQAINTNLRIKPLITLLCRIYDYKLQEVLSFDLVDCFLNHLKCQNSKSGEVCAAVILLAKRNDRAWTLTQLIPKYLAPIIQEWRCGKINEAVICDVIDLIGCVVKPFSEECDMGAVLKIFKGILHADQVTKTLKMKAALNLARQAAHHFPEVAPALFEWVPEGELPDEFWKQMSDILSVKPHSYWTTFLSTCEENSDEMCVGALNN